MLTLVVAAAVVVPLATATGSSAHGWVTDPPSRAENCAAGTTSFDCGKIKYEPQSVEAPKGSLKCSGGAPEYTVLDDETKPWPRKNIASTIDIKWNLTALHATQSWEYFLDGTLVKTVDAHGAKPTAVLSHRLTNLPRGQHTILARWNVADTPMAFYSCLDVNVKTDGSLDPSTAPTEPAVTPTPTETPTHPPAGVCEAAEWKAGSSYSSSSQVSYRGSIWRAKWWTLGEAPSVITSNGAWAYERVCGATTPSATATATATATPTATPTATATATPTATATATPTPTPTATATANVPGCRSIPWVPGNIYAGGDTVSRNEHNWSAQWWTQGDEPGRGDPWGVWKDLGAC